MFEIVACVDNQYGIGLKNKLPWKNKNDIQHFKRITTDNNTLNKINIVIMGNNTFKSILKPLPNRLSIVLSKSIDCTNPEITFDISQPLYYNCYQKLLLAIHAFQKNINKVFIIGGSQIYSLFTNLHIVSTIHLTVIYKNYNCDTFLDKNILKQFEVGSSSLKKFKIFQTPIEYFTYRYVNKDENNYLHLLNNIITNGIYKIDRTNIGIVSKFGKQLKFNVRNWRLPLYTHRKMFARGIIEELLFFISGSTNTKLLENKKVNIWKGHTSREFLNSRHLVHYQEGEYGPMYGYLLRHWGYPYQGLNHDYSNKGIDQLAYVINEIKTNPTSRRILFSYWNPSVFDEQPLYSCHILYQFYVDVQKNEISCMFTMRSNDFALANCFNVCSATLLLFMICKVTGYNPGKVVYNVNDCHVYQNQIDVVQQFSKNKTYNFPLCYLDNITNITDFKYEHFKIMFYNSNGSYSIPMAI